MNVFLEVIFDRLPLVSSKGPVIYYPLTKDKESQCSLPEIQTSTP